VAAAPRLALIAALARNGVIGRNGALPWRLAADLKRFRALTMGHHIVMGRKTYQSIGRPLPGRESVVISRNAQFSAPGCLRANSLAQALALARADDEVFVIGGAALYRDALPLAQRLYLTEVAVEVAGDTFFPAFDRSHWREISREHVPAGADNELPSDFAVYDRVVASSSA
jgi:dihydrofolate reductase